MFIVHHALRKWESPPALVGGYRVEKMNSKWWDEPEHLDAYHPYSPKKFYIKVQFHVKVSVTVNAQKGTVLSLWQIYK